MNPVKFSRKTLPQKEGLGDKLAKKRVALGLTVRDVEKAIRVRADYIEDLENGTYDRLPPEVFVKGFIRSYAELLKLDPEKVYRLYQKERGLVETVKKVNKKAPTVKAIKGPKLVVTPKKMIMIAVIAVALVIVAYIGWQVSILTAPPKLTLNSPIENTLIKSDSVAVSGKTDPTADLFINDVEVGVNQDGTFTEKVSLQSGVNTIKVRSQNKLGKYTESSRVIVAEPPNLPTAITALNPAVDLKVTIGPKSASLQVEVDGKKVTEKPVIMSAGITQTYKAAEKIVINTNNGGSVKVVYNNQDLGAIGKDNETVKKEFVKGMQIK